MPIRVFACFAVCWAFADPAAALEESLTVDAILERAIATYKQNEEAGRDTRFDYVLSSHIEKLDDSGGIEEVEDLRYVSDHLEGVPYERLVSKDGKPLNEKEIREEEERRAKFQKKLAEGRANHDDTDESVTLNEALVKRFDIVLEGIERLGDHDCYRLSFAPKPGKLPVERRIDRVLNKSAGSLWVDVASFEVARVEFELMDPVGLWGGIAGKVSEMRGSFERRPVQVNVWLPGEFELYMRARFLFRKLHLRQRVRWTDFEPRPERLSTTDSGN